MTEKSKDYVADDEISLADVVLFAKRQYKKFLSIFIFCVLVVCAFIFTRPTLYESKADLLIGSKYFFLQNSQQDSQQNLIETADQVKFLYSGNVNITPQKKTAIITLTATNEVSKDSQQALETTIEKIISEHRKILGEKRSEAVLLLQALQNTSTKDVLLVIDSASSANMTKQISEISTSAIPYGGLLKKGLSIGLLISAFIAFVIVFVIDRVNQLNYKR